MHWLSTSTTVDGCGIEITTTTSIFAEHYQQQQQQNSSNSTNTSSLSLAAAGSGSPSSLNLHHNNKAENSSTDPTTHCTTIIMETSGGATGKAADQLGASESELFQALGLSPTTTTTSKGGAGRNNNDDSDQQAGDRKQAATSYKVVPDPSADNADLSGLVRGGDASNSKMKNGGAGDPDQSSENAELENLAELVPDLKSRKSTTGAGAGGASGAEMMAGGDNNDGAAGGPKQQVSPRDNTNNATSTMVGTDEAVEVTTGAAASKVAAMGGGMSPNKNETGQDDRRKMSLITHDSAHNKKMADFLLQQQLSSQGGDSDPRLQTGAVQDGGAGGEPASYAAAAATKGNNNSSQYENTGGDAAIGDDSFDDYPDSEQALDDDVVADELHTHHNDSKVPKEFVNHMSSGQSISTATQTHEVRMPMYLPTFKPATGCTNASDFIVRCFVARLRSGITVVKHGRSRWCKSRLRILHIHPDGRSLSWKPAEGEPSSSKRPPKLDLSTCLEVRHAWSPDPQNPMYTGTPILRQKCEAANAHKSFALIFKQRTVDITAVTADQCKVLMEGFSALCFRLQVAKLAGPNNNPSAAKDAKAKARPMPEEDGISTTASATLTNKSTPRNDAR